MNSHTSSKTRIQLQDAQTGEWTDITHAFDNFAITMQMCDAAASQLAQAFTQLGNSMSSFGRCAGDILAELIESELAWRWRQAWRYGFVLVLAMVIVSLWMGS